MEIRSELVVASDIHLRQADDPRSRQLLRLIESLRSPEVRHFVLLGDIFDFCLGSSNYFKSKFKWLGDALSALAARGTQVWFFEGNHEFNMEKIGWQGVQIISEPYRVISLKSGKRVALSHGDLMYSSWDYRVFRALVKSGTAKQAARFIPGKLIELYAFGHATVSRGRDEYRKLDHAALLTSAEKWIRQAACDVGIFGHFHVPYAETATTGGPGTVRIYSMDCWDKPNVLLCDGDRFERGFFREDGKFERIEPVSFRGLIETQKSVSMPRATNSGSLTSH